MTQNFKTVLAVIGVVTPAVFSYLAARSTSDEARIRAEVAYTTMSDVVKELQEASHSQELLVARIEGQLSAKEPCHSEAQEPKITPRAPTATPKPIARVPASFPEGVSVEWKAPLERKSRPNFDQAVQTFKAKK